MGYIKSAAARRDRLRRPRPLQPGARPQGVAGHRVRRLEVVGRHPLRAARQRQGRDRVQRLLEPHAAAHRQGRRLDPVAGREGPEPHAPRAGARLERRSLPRDRAAAERRTPTRLYNLHQDDNNRLNPDGTGWVVRGFFNLTDDTDSFFVLRENRTDPSVEYRIALPAGAQLIIDTQRLWHAATHLGIGPALLPHHLVGVGPRARRVHREAQRREQGAERGGLTGHPRRRSGRADPSHRRSRRVLRGQGAGREDGHERGLIRACSVSERPRPAPVAESVVADAH